MHKACSSVRLASLSQLHIMKSHGGLTAGLWHSTNCRLYMMGINILAYSHFDEYLVDFSSFKPGPIDDKVFAVPSMCKEKDQGQTSSSDFADLRPSSVRGATAGVMASVAAMPWAQLPGGVWLWWCCFSMNVYMA